MAYILFVRMLSNQTSYKQMSTFSFSIIVYTRIEKDISALLTFKTDFGVVSSEK